MKLKFAKDRTDYVVLFAKPCKKDSVLTIGVANIPEIERKIESSVKKCICIDMDKVKICGAKNYLKKTIFIHGDITNPPKNLFGKFDTVIMLEVLEHIDKDFETLKIIYELLKKNGKLIISVPNKHFLHLINPVRYTQHKRHYSISEITLLLEKVGFKIKHVNTVESPKLIFDLYVHLFCKYILHKKVKFGIFSGKDDKTYEQINTPHSALDCFVVAVKP